MAATSMIAFVVASLCSVQGARDDSVYLKKLAADTWRCIDKLTDSRTGLPYDNSDRGEYTSVSNIGLLLSDTAVARELGLLTNDQALQRMGRTLKSLESMKTWFGFQQCWNSIVTLEPATHDRAVSLIDSGNLAASLIAVSQAEPKLARRCLTLFQAMDWRHFYDRDREAVLGGYDTGKQASNPNWRLDSVASDALLAIFFAIAVDAAPPTVYDKLSRSSETQYGETYLRPGWEGGGLFMQFISGIWLDTGTCEVGKSAAAFCRSQMAKARAIGAPVWGWSACDNPDGGYLGWGSLKDEVATPHASAFAIGLFPNEIIANLRAFEKLGARSPSDGFYDSLNWRTGKHSKLFLTLDQSMLFLSIGNYLRHDLLRRWFQQNPTVRRGRTTLGPTRGF